MDHEPRILCGIDPGLGQTGYAVLRVAGDSKQVTLSDAGVIRSGRRGPLSERLVELADGIDEVLTEHAVNLVAVEKVYSHYQRPTTAIQMAHARGAILLTAGRQNIEVRDIPATTVKRYLTGNGRADKSQVQRAVANLLGLETVPEPPDVADALAIALCASQMIHRPDLTDGTQVQSSRG